MVRFSHRTTNTEEKVRQLTTFRSPCDRCLRVRYLDKLTSLCATVTDEPKLLSEMDTCFEWARYYAVTDWGVMDDLEDAA